MPDRIGTPGVTVGLPVFNDAPGLRRSIPSIMAQRWGGEIHLLVIDDGSTDDTLGFLEEVQTRWPNVTIVRNSRNRGRAHARNQVLEHAKSEYLAWIDSDDLWYPDKLQRQFEVLQARIDDRGVLCTCPYRLVWVGQDQVSLRKPRLCGDQLKNLLDGSLYPYLWTMLGRTDTFRDVGGFDERLARRQDYEFMLRFLNDGGGEVVSPDPAIALCEYHRTDVGRSGWQVAAANRRIWRIHRKVFKRYQRCYAYDRRAAQHALSARFFGANGQKWPELYYGLRKKSAEARLKVLQSVRRQRSAQNPAQDGKSLRDAKALEQKVQIFGAGLSVPPPPVESCAPEVLRTEYEGRALAAEPDTFVLYRIIGNDLQPRHVKGQSFNNLRFLLEHEPALADCEKRWIVNRIFDRQEERRIIQLLEAHGQPYLHVPFDENAYQRVGLDFDPFPEAGVFWRSAYHRLGAGDMRRIMMGVFRRKNIYAMHNNGARNLALEDGRRRAKWVLPWDGNCFLTADAWAEVRRGIVERPMYKYALVPMARVTNNSLLLSQGFAPAAEEEPQVVFRRDARERFDERWPYGRRPKMELLWRLGVPWKSEHWKNQPWDPKVPELSPEAGQYQFAGWVARLDSGKAEYERADKKAFLARGIARENAVVAALEHLDASALRLPPEPLVIDAEWLERQASDPAFETSIARLRAEADTALARGPYSVVDKYYTPVGTLNDYWCPAPYWWPNPKTLNGRPYVRHEGKRRPGTRLFEAGSEQYDRTRLQRLCDDTLVLALAHQVTGHAKYARQARRLLRCWFLDEATRMTPHLTYAEARLGHGHNRGTGRGVIQSLAFWYLLEGVRLLSRSGELDEQEVSALKAWFQQYLNWLLDSRQGRWAQGRVDFHGASYEVQVTAMAAFVGQPDVIVQSLYRAEEKIHHQLHELVSKPRAAAPIRGGPERLGFNLHAWTHLHYLSRACGRDLWEVEPVREKIRRAMEQAFVRVAASRTREKRFMSDEHLAPLIAVYQACFGPLSGGLGAVDLQVIGADPGSLAPEGIRPFWQLGGERRQTFSLAAPRAFATRASA